MATQLATQSLATDLERDGIAIVPDLLSPEQVSSMQRAFRRRLKRMRWNDFDGYEKTERYRHMVQDILTLDQGFVDLALHPVIKETLRDYLGDRFALAEAKGWLSLPTTEDFHGWHGDAWYNQETVKEVQREVKVGLYLTDVRTGAFNYIRRSHGQLHPRPQRTEEVRAKYAAEDIIEVTGSAGTAILFDTTGIHRQGMPILEPRQAVFYCYHDPAIPLQREDINYYRYHPLTLNAAFLGDLSAEDQRILGFGDKTNYVAEFERHAKHEGYQRFMGALFDGKLRYDLMRRRVTGKLRRQVSR